ncbi:unnamed protein product [Owenia fusiformis]|uniref:peptidylprolyl isomerase n=1 Tax=Owenia fusiformis TaxID=6347 RepID=A0A8J1TLR2_OWEFU|nr:unnamed protein product [Owenia fusiformis]
MEDITEEKNGGVLKKVLTPGHGPLCPEEASVLVHFNGYLEYKDEPFDSSRLRNKPDRIKLGDCILGWTIGIKTMKKGELSRFIIRSDYGWGPQGCPPRIPEDSTVMFEIELIEAFARAGVDDYESTPMSERKFLPFEKIYMAAHSAKDEAKTHYHNGHYRQASRKYEKAIRILEECCLRNDDEERKQQEMLKTLYLNCATCKDKLSSPKPVITLCNKALEIDKDSVKAYYLLGVAYLRLGDFTASRKKLMVARKLKPQFKCVSKALAELESVEKQLRNEEAAMYKRMISGAGKNEENETGRSVTQRTNLPPDSVDQLDPEYKANIKTRIQAFKHNQDLDSLDIGSLGMTPVEIAYIIDLAEELGIEWKEYGTGESYQVKLVKS